MKIKLKTEMIEKKDGSFVFMAQKPFIIKGLNQDQSSFLKKLKSPLSMKDYERDIKSSKAIKKIAHLLEENSLIQEIEKNPWQGLAQERQGDYCRRMGWSSLDCKKNVENTLITLLGCGGTGSNLAMLLAACGFKKFQFIDFDVVALNNFNRQHLFSLADIGRPKIDALKDRIIERFSQVSIETKRLRIDSIDDLERCRSIKSKSQLFILCADTPAHLIRKWTTQFCFSNSIPLFFGAVGLYESSVGPLLQSKNHFKNYLKKLEEMKRQYKTRNLKPIEASFGPSNLLTCSLMADQIFRFVIRKPIESLGTSQRIKFDSLFQSAE